MRIVEQYKKLEVIIVVSSSQTKKKCWKSSWI